MNYDIVIPISVKDVGILLKNIIYIKKYLDHEKIIIIGNEQVFLKIKHILLDEIIFMNEDEIYDGLSYSKVAEILEVRCGNKRRTGWYLQQFIKLSYSYKCKHDYYLVWDADTIPLKKIDFFEDEKVLFNLKDEYNKPYFRTIEKLFTIKKGKIEKKSFISEHMLFNKKIVDEMLENICKNTTIFGNSFFEKILYSIKKSDLNKSGFSEFETYGTYCLLHHRDCIKYRDLSTLRYGKRFLGDNPSNESLKWASIDFDTISFEKFDRPSKKVMKYCKTDYMMTHRLKDIYNKNKIRLSFCEKIRSLIRNIVR